MTVPVMCGNFPYADGDIHAALLRHRSFRPLRNQVNTPFSASRKRNVQKGLAKQLAQRVPSAFTLAKGSGNLHYYRSYACTDSGLQLI